MIVSKQRCVSSSATLHSDSESDVYGASRRKKTNRKHRRNLLHAASDSGPTHAEIRFSTRKAAKVSNYNEDDSDDFEDDDQDMLAPNYYVTVPLEEDVAGIDAILNHRPREDISE